VVSSNKVNIGANTAVLHLTEVEVIEPDLLVCEDRREVDLDSRGRVEKIPSARQLVRQDGGVTAPRAGRDRPGWPMAAHQLASAYKKFRASSPVRVEPSLILKMPGRIGLPL